MFLFSSSFRSSFSDKLVELAFSPTKSLQGFLLEPFGRPRFRFSGLAKFKRKKEITETTFFFPYETLDLFGLVIVDMISQKW